MKKKKKSSIKRSLLFAVGILLFAVAADLFFFGSASLNKQRRTESSSQEAESSADAAESEEAVSSDGSSGANTESEEAGETEDSEGKSALTGIRMLGMGDSLLCGHLEGNGASWFDAIGRKYGMVYYNFAVSGETVAYSDQAKAEHGAASMVRRQEAIIEKVQDVDLIILEGGTNDKGDDIPIGEDSDYQDSSFKGALNIMIDRFQAAYPDALIVCMTPYRWTNGKTNSLGLTYSDYSQAMKEICSLQGVLCLDNERNSSVDFGNDAYLQWADEGLSFGFADVNRHFNLKAQEKLQAVYENYLEEKLAEWKKAKAGENEEEAASAAGGTAFDSQSSSDPLSGKSIIAVGDGMINGHSLGEGFSWLTDIGMKHGMTYYNFGVNKSSIAYSAAAFADGNLALCRQYQTVLDIVPSADIVLIEGGMNDRNYNIPIGEQTDQGDETFLGALNSLIDRYQAAYPEAKILCMTPYHRNDVVNDLGLSDMDYAAAMLSLCESRGISCYNNYALSGVDFTNSDYASYADEGLYLGREANQHFSPAAYANIESLYEEWLLSQYQGE